MIWDKVERKRFLKRSGMAIMACYALGLCLLSLSAMAGTPAGDYRITLTEAEQRIAEELMRQGVGEDMEVDIVGRRSEDLVRRSEPVVMEVVDLTTDTAAQRFTVSLNFSTEAALNKPGRTLGNLVVSGRYEEMREVPVIKYRLKDKDVIREEDIGWQKLPASRLRRDTVLDAEALIGKSPVRSLSPERPVRLAEIQSPPLVFRLNPVKMLYQTEHVQIQAVGTAMQDGAMGEKIKVRNDDSGIELDAIVIDRGRVEILPPITLAVR